MGDSEDFKVESHDTYQLTAFLLSFFLGSFGADWLYCGWIWVGLTKMLFGVLSWGSCLWAAGYYAKNEIPEEFTFCCVYVPFMICMLCCTFLCWWLTDVILFALNMIPDSEWNYLIPW